MRSVLLAGLVWAMMPVAAIAQYTTRHPSFPTCPALTSATPPMGGAMRVWLDGSTGRRILIIQGGVQRGSADQIANAIRVNQPIDQIWVNSQGGNAEEGNRITRIIRDSGIPVHIPDDWWCVSACNFIFFGGAIRTIDPRGVLAVHMATHVRSEDTPRTAGQVQVIEEEMARLTYDDIDLIIRMGISRRLLSEVMYAQSASGVRCLTRDEMRRYNVVNVG
ncbi:MAG: hypothetical protein Q8S53_01625 [Brevundimonas sp.]|uniref:COG3904 family protein n=1 Tax=Brevundimonas sp. TaxID=1871086 RepID=UPI002732B67D|nr:hypothetical protein [Brevundimonas sp.]MDP3377035.1 hypothetical protein [Brevundimonas sp.]